MRNNNVIAIGAVAIIALIAILFFVPSLWEGGELAVSPEQEQRDFAEAKEDLQDGNPATAMETIEKYKPFILDGSERGKKWLPLFVKAGAESKDARQLLELYSVQHQAFNQNEDAAVVIADALIKTFRADDYQVLREQWVGKENRPEIWFVLDADQLIIEGKRQSAIDLLNSRSFQGKDDAGRLVRLALLHVREQPRTAWEYLSEAQSKDPENHEIRSYRAQLLEAIGKDSLALTEYLSAVKLAPESVHMRDQLAEFYRRQGRFPEAIQVWQQDFETSPFDEYVWMKAWFWSHVVTNPDIDWAANKPPEGNIQPFLNYLYNLPENTFWNDTQFAKVPDGEKYLNSQQLTFWLRLIQALKEENETEAWELLQYNKFATVSWNPELEKALKLILTYRKLGTFSSENVSGLSGDFQESPISLTQKRGNKKTHPFFTQIEALASKNIRDQEELPEGLHDFLTGPEAFTGAFLSSGWLETAIDLNTLKVIPNDSPDWFAYGLTQALRFNRGPLEALEFATKQKQTPPLEMLIGELLIASGSPDAGLEQLEKLAHLDNDIGFRSSWLISLLYMERGEYDKSRVTIATQPLLANSILGKETLARIALLENNQILADRLYTDIEDSSWEAKSYLARRAFAEKDFQRARYLTETLLKEFPNNNVLRKNLSKIIEKQEDAEAGNRSDFFNDTEGNSYE